jgi:AcrR family transcriptional regulator
MTSMTARHQPERPLRADAARNRDAIVAVARDVFAEQGLEAPLEAIAARAGVGIATLYRRFPTREKLVSAALVDKVAEYVDAARQALAVPDPWAASPAASSGSASCRPVTAACPTCCP